jgi:chaperonin GroEL
MTKDVKFGDEAQEKIRAGIDKIADAVGSTLGPKGRNVLIGKGTGDPIVTKDGVTVAKEFELKDEFENAGAQMLKAIASKASEVAGDGTTTSTVLGRALYYAGLQAANSGCNVVCLKNGMHKAVDAVVEDIRTRITKIKTKSQIAQVATIASNNDEFIGKIIAEAMERVGTDGVITVEEGKTNDTSVDLIAGMRFDKGWVSSYYATEEDKQSCIFFEPRIILSNSKNIEVEEILPFLQTAHESHTPLLFIAPDFNKRFTNALIVNVLKLGLRVCCVKAPGFGDSMMDSLKDIATATGGVVHHMETGKLIDLVQKTDPVGNKVTDLSALGTCAKVIVTKDSFTILEGAGDGSEGGAIEKHVKHVKSLIEQSSGEYETEKLQERLARLAGGVAQINVGAASEIEMKQKKARIEDALHATKAAIDSGTLPGGGIALLRSRAVLDELKNQCKGDEQRGVEITYSALACPTSLIAENAGKNGELIIEHILEKDDYNYGYDAAADEYGDMVDKGIIDPAKVTITALNTAASIAGMLLTSQAILVEERSEPAGGIQGIF